MGKWRVTVIRWLLYLLGLMILALGLKLTTKLTLGSTQCH